MMYKRLFPVSAQNYEFPKDAKARVLNQFWRLNHIYDVVDEQGVKRPFVMRPQQCDFYFRRVPRNLILKSRQHGFTTFCCLLALDNAITRPNYRAHFIQPSKDECRYTLRDKIKEPWERMIEHYPELAKMCNVMESEKDNKFELKFKNDSSVSTALSAHPGTVQFVHISEYARICAKTPDRANEINTGSISTLSRDGTLIIESTAEGKIGDFYNKTMAAMKQQRERKKLNEMELKFFFYPWWMDLKNILPPRKASLIPPDDVQYFKKLKDEHGVDLMPGQKVWYSAQKRMLDEYIFRVHPSTPEEAFAC